MEMLFLHMAGEFQIPTCFRLLCVMGVSRKYFISLKSSVLLHKSLILPMRCVKILPPAIFSFKVFMSRSVEFCVIGVIKFKIRTLSQLGSHFEN